MPETTVDKDHRFMYGKNYVWFAGEVLEVESKTEAHRM
jgi:hypothetical protein